MADGNRLYSYDVVRVVAMFFVIAVHSLSVVDTSTNIGFLFFATGQALFFTANALFFMMSGKFNVREYKTDQDLKRYFIKKIRNIMLPIFILFFIRTLYDLFPNYGSIFHFGKEYIENSLGLYAEIEYWFVFTLVGFLLVAPFLAPSFLNMSKFAQKIFLAIGLIYNLFVLFSSNYDFPFSWGYLFSGFAFTFFIGTFIDKLFTTKKQVIAMLVAALLSLMVTVWFAWNGKIEGIHDISPFYTLIAIGIYLLIIYLFKNSKPSKIISFMAEHSFSVYLVHMMVLMPITKMLPPDTGLSTIAVYFGVVVVVFLLSLLLAVTIDKLIVKPAQKLFDKIVPMPKKETSTIDQ